jgi:secreted PhoX family phosphatase
MIGRRALLGSASLGGSLGAGPAAAQITSLDLSPASVPVRPDDWLAAGHARATLLRWGDRVAFDAPPWDPRATTAEAAALQAGWDMRIAGLIVPPVAADGVPRLVLALAHPEVDPAMAFPQGRAGAGLMAASAGASLLNLELQDGRWVLVDGGFQSRRITHETLCRLTGPAMAGAVQGLLPPACGCATPWGSLLLAEPEPGPWLARLACTARPWLKTTKGNGPSPGGRYTVMGSGMVSWRPNMSLTVAWVRSTSSRRSLASTSAAGPGFSS